MLTRDLICPFQLAATLVSEIAPRASTLRPNADGCGGIGVVIENAVGDGHLARAQPGAGRAIASIQVSAVLRVAAGAHVLEGDVALRGQGHPAVVVIGVDVRQGDVPGEIRDGQAFPGGVAVEHAVGDRHRAGVIDQHSTIASCISAGTDSG